MKRLTVSPGGRSLMWEDGTPFFYLADTAWELAQRLDRHEVRDYLHVRRDQRFNAIQVVALSELSGGLAPNAHGRLPLRVRAGAIDPCAPDTGGGYDYWQHLDYIVSLAADMGMIIALLPCWGSYIIPLEAGGQAPFTREGAQRYARWIAQRYRHCWNILWVLGGDRTPSTPGQLAIVDAMGEAIRDADPDHLITYHPSGHASSAAFLTGRDYLDFHMIQSSHSSAAYESPDMLRQAREAEGKPYMDGEPRYEGIAAYFRPDYGVYWDDADVRQNAYWNLLEGACGLTYGHHSVWQFNRAPGPGCPHAWREALAHPGAAQMRHAAQLRLSLPGFDLEPAPALLPGDTALFASRSAARAQGCALVYAPLGMPLRVRLQALHAQTVRASWFDPRTGASRAFGVMPAQEAWFAPPTSGRGCDWVLVLHVLA